MTVERTGVHTEWLEADGLGGFSSGTAAGINTRRYHALLLGAEVPPANRRVLVNDAAIWLESGDGVLRLSRHRFTPDVTTDMDAIPTGFDSKPWPRFSYQIDGATLQKEIVALHGLPVVVLRFRFDRRLPGARLCIRPLLSGRDFHALHHENAAFDFTARGTGHRVSFRPYPGVTGVLSLASGRYRHAPEWYRRFQYDVERDRGLDHVEDLASPGVIEAALDEREATWVLAADTAAARAFLGERDARAVATDVLDRERARRGRFATRLERAADSYLVRRGDGKTMDAKVGEHVVTPRIGKPVEVQALWFNALSFAGELLDGADGVSALAARAARSFRARFVDARTGALHDVVDANHEPGRIDASLRPNQVFAAGGLPFTPLSRAECRAVLDVVERELWTPSGLRSLAPSDPAYVPRYRGGVWERDTAYHQGTVWPWLAGPFIQAWVHARGGTEDVKREARARFLRPLRSLLEAAGAGHLPEVADADAPHTPGGCFFQAWSVAELVRVERTVLAESRASTRENRTGARA